jgi:hypothetical protein
MTGRLRLQPVREDLVQDVLGNIPTRTFEITGSNYVNGSSHRNELFVDFEYGPVWGCRPYDVRRRAQTAAREAGSQAAVEIVYKNRVVVERRERES